MKERMTGRSKTGSSARWGTALKVLGLLICCAPFASADYVYDEAVDGDLPHPNAAFVIPFDGVPKPGQRIFNVAIQGREVRMQRSNWVDGGENLGLRLHAPVSRWYRAYRGDFPLLQIILPVTYLTDDGVVSLAVDQAVVRSVPLPVDATFDPAVLLSEEGQHLLVGFALLPDGAVLAPYVRAFHGNVNDPFGPAGTRNDELEEWMLSVVDALWFANLGPTGLDEPVDLVMSVSDTMGGVEARLWAPNRETEAWLVETYRQGGPR